jgi:outer membrane protein OmpA-like peptidoglycan-associated protein/ABC-type nitrate/sulfonate/bicarbonate transport system substrate-binding protein
VREPLAPTVITNRDVSAIAEKHEQPRVVSGMTHLTRLSKLLITGIVLGSGATAFQTYGARLTSEPKHDSVAASSVAPSANRPVRVAVSQWPGHMALLIGAGGLKTQPGSPADAEKLDLDIQFIEDAPAKNKALQTGDVDFVWQTVDELPISLGAYREAKVDVRAFLQIDWSRGGDACISSKEVQKVEDIVGRKSAMLLFSPDHTVFEFMITNSRLTPDQVRDTRKATQFSPDDFTFGRTLFTEGKIDVACLWEPDVTLALAGRPGSHRLFSTADATELVADVLLVRKDYLDTHLETAEKLARVWFQAVDIAEHNRPAAARLISTVASRFRDELGYEKTLAALEWAKWTTLTDNVRFFGLDGTSPAFDRVYNQADGIWVNYPQAEIKDRFAPVMLRDDRVVRRVWEARGKPTAGKAESYETRTAQAGSAVFTKPVSITFPSGSNELNPESIAAINQQILPQLEIARGMSIRLEGNTDYIGDRWQNQRLSELRAQAILEFLVTRGVPRERMVARGNGPLNPVASNTTPEGRAQNRRTDVLFIRNPKATP